MQPLSKVLVHRYCTTAQHVVTEMSQQAGVHKAVIDDILDASPTVKVLKLRTEKPLSFVQVTSSQI